jgi:two-component system, NtrC family, response regulator AtoC
MAGPSSTQGGDAPTQSLEAALAPVSDASSILVIDELSSRRVALPRNGTLTVGRSSRADIRIDSTAVSRIHAKLMVAGGEVQLVDLKSHNGTLVNSEPIRGSRILSSGDVVTIGQTTLVLHAARTASRRSLIDMAQMRSRLEDEVARAMEYPSTFALAVVRLEEPCDRSAAAAETLASLRRMDSIALDRSTIVALLPELSGEAARSAAGLMVAAVAPLAVRGARAGVASYPVDGSDAETLLAGARSAATMAAPGGVCAASEATLRHAIGDHQIVIADAVMARLYELIRRLAASDLSVLLLGETGTGKENAARALHDWSSRASRPFVALNCASLPETLVESELFGHERGAFSDAHQSKPGLLERADGGTVFLDEVGDLPPGAQAKFLRVLEQHRITRLGDVREREVDFRVVAATNRDLESAVRADRFRSDLLFRLSAAVVELPPLRQRRREIPLLARFFVERECARRKRAPMELAESTLVRLAEHSFPGNVRELKNAIDYAVATAEGSTIHPWHLPPRMVASATPSPVEAAARDAGAAPGTSVRTQPRLKPIAEELRELEKTRMLEALDACHGVQKDAAAAIGMPVRTFTFKLKQYGIAWRQPRRES